MSRFLAVSSARQAVLPEDRLDVSPSVENLVLHPPRGPEPCTPPAAPHQRCRRAAGPPSLRPFPFCWGAGPHSPSACSLSLGLDDLARPSDEASGYRTPSQLTSDPWWASNKEIPFHAPS